MSDAVNRPAHYTAGRLEVIDYIRQQLGDEGFIAYCRGNAIKYLSRAGRKHLTENQRAEDFAKATWYAQMCAHVCSGLEFADPRMRGEWA